MHHAILLATLLQTTPAPQTKCPVLAIESSRTDKGEALFQVTADPIPTGSITANWAISAGAIAWGQGTGSIAVEAAKGTIVTATVEIGGLPAQCADTVSISVEVGANSGTEASRG